MTRSQQALVAAILSDEDSRSDLRVTGPEALTLARQNASAAALERVVLPLLRPSAVNLFWADLARAPETDDRPFQRTGRTPLRRAA